MSGKKPCLKVETDNEQRWRVKTCPFCGGEADVGVEFLSDLGSEVNLVATVRCSQCYCRKTFTFQAAKAYALIPFNTFTEAFDAAVKEWNTRADDSP